MSPVVAHHESSPSPFDRPVNQVSELAAMIIRLRTRAAALLAIHAGAPPPGSNRAAWMQYAAASDLNSLMAFVREVAAP